MPVSEIKDKYIEALSLVILAEIDSFLRDDMDADEYEIAKQRVKVIIAKEYVEYADQKRG